MQRHTLTFSTKKKNLFKPLKLGIKNLRDLDKKNKTTKNSYDDNCKKFAKKKYNKEKKGYKNQQITSFI